MTSQAAEARSDRRDGVAHFTIAVINVNQPESIAAADNCHHLVEQSLVVADHQVPNHVFVELNDPVKGCQSGALGGEKCEVVKTLAMAVHFVGQLGILPGAMSHDRAANFGEDFCDFTSCGIRICSEFSAVKNEHAFVVRDCQLLIPLLWFAVGRTLTDLCFHRLELNRVQSGFDRSEHRQ